MAKNGTTVSGVRFLDENNTGYRIYSAKDGSNNKQLRMFEATSGGGGLFLNGSNGNRPYYFDGSSNSYRLLDVSDKTSLETSISTKANTDLSNVPSSKGILTESYVNGTSWYRVYSDGWCEQGGFSTGTGNANQVQTITFLKNFADTNFYFNGAQFAGSINANYLNFITESGRNVSDITLLGSVNRYWQACGYISQERFMEIKATLNKPYTDKQRIDFIVSQNHTNGYEIKETENALEAWGYTEEEQQAQAKEARKKELIAELDALDLKCIRALRSIQAGTGTEDDTARLAELEEQAEEIRKELQLLNPVTEVE